MHFYEWDIGAYAKKTQHLSNEEDLAYRRALDLYYDTEKPLLTDGLATLSRRLRVDEESLKRVLDEFFPDGKNKHAEEKIAAYYAYIAKQAANGKLGGRPKRTQAKPTAKPKKPSAKPLLITESLITDNLKLTTLSGKPDETPSLEEKPRINGYLADARMLLTFLNEKANRRYPPSDANVNLIVARLRECEKMGLTSQNCRSMIAMKVTEWKADEKMSKFLRPKTLFNATNFSTYIGELHHD